MKIDLHCHTLKIKDGDPETRNVTADIFAKKITNSGVKIVAITNHNVFDIIQYNELRECVQEYCDVWPGIELDVFGDSMKKEKLIKFHMIIIVNPRQAEEFAQLASDLLDNENVNTFEKHISIICKKFEGMDALYIPHYMGKTPAITEEDLKLLRELVKDESRVFTETTESSIGVLINYGFHALVGSDVRDWNNYEESSFSELRLPVSSFEQFCMLSQRDAVVIDTILNEKKSYIFRARPHCKVSFDLKLYEDINIIFGQKGTGKSEILNSLYEEVVKSGMKCVKYIGSQKEEGFQRLLSTSDMKRSCELLAVETCEDEIRILQEWQEPGITLFSKYVKWYQTRNNNENKKKMKITEAIDLPPEGTNQYSELRQDRKVVLDICKNLKGIDLQLYLSDTEQKTFHKLIEKLDAEVYRKVITEYSKIKVVELTNISVNKIKELADMKTDTVSKPSTTGFLEFAKKHLDIKQSIIKIEKALNANEHYEDERIGELEGKGNIIIRSRYRMLCKDSKTKEFDNGINNLKQIKHLLNIILDRYYEHDISIKLDELSYALQQESIKDIRNFIGLSKTTVDEAGDSYEPSTGEKGILLLQQIISEDADAYFFDEPELGMGNSYIDANIRPRINNLAKKHKIVLIATHNANLAVRTLPYMSIFRKYDNGNYYTYVGNPFRNELVNIDDKDDMLNWTNESMHTLEGGRPAFYERKEIYESGS